MFRDLKEYQEIQNLYENQVYLSEEDENELLDIIESFDLTDDEIEYFVENYEEFYQDEEVILLENPLKALKTLKTIRTAGKFGGGIKTGINLQKSAKRANIKNMLGRKPFDPVGKKFSGPVNLNKNFAKFSSIKDKLQKNAKGLAIAGGTVGTVALARQLGKGSDVKKEKEKKEIEDKVKDKTITQVKSVTAGGGSSVDAEGKKIPSTAEIRAKSDRVGGGNAGASTDSGGTQGKGGVEKTTETKTKTTDPTDTKGTQTKTQTSTTTTDTKKKKMHSIEKKNRARFGDAKVDALKAKNKDFQAMKKGGMTKDEFIKKYPKSITAQRSKGLRDHTEWDAYDIVLEYLMSTGQVDTIEEANYVMMQLDKENIQEIAGIRTAMKVGKAIGRFGAKNPVNFAATLGGAGVVGQTAVKPIAQTLGKITAPKVETPKVQTSTNDIQVGSGIDARQPGESVLDYAKRRKKSLETQDRKLGAGEY